MSRGRTRARISSAASRMVVHHIVGQRPRDGLRGALLEECEHLTDPHRVVGGERAHRVSAMRTAFEEPEQRQALQRLPNRAPADAELPGEGHLDQPFARSEAALQDPGAERGHHLVDSGLGHVRGRTTHAR